jgi:hypothetical protein
MMHYLPQAAAAFQCRVSRTTPKTKQNLAQAILLLLESKIQFFFLKGI